VKDLYTASHSQHVEILCDLLWHRLPRHLRRKVKRKNLLRAAHLHDVGKLFCSDNILNKPGKLTDEEFEEMKLHPVIGAKLLDRTTHHRISNYVYHHHERPDGTGYFKAQSDQIPLESLMIGICDAFSAITTNRVYDAAKPISEAKKIIQDNKGQQFDEELADIFCAIPDQELRSIDTMIKGQYFVGGKRRFRIKKAV
jgi:HD-GYP domain-containing protein (c-di-GMP phosphodiesterase class II)